MTAVGLDEERHVYTHPPTGNELVSCTTALDQTCDRAWRAQWWQKLCFNATLANLERVCGLIAAKRADEARRLVYAEAEKARTLAADVGSYVHTVQENLLLDVPIPPIPDHLVGQVTRDGDRVDQEYVDSIADGFLAFCADFGVVRGRDVEAAEMTVANPDLGWAGTLDLIHRIPSLPGLGTLCTDTKTGRNMSGTWIAQLAAYRRATEAWIQLDHIVAMPRTDRAAILHLRSPEYAGGYRRGYKLFVLDPAEEAAGYDAFLGALERWKYNQTHPGGRPGQVWYPPLPDGTQPPPMVEDLTGYAGAPGALVRAAPDLETVADVAMFDADALAALRGIGPKRLEGIAEMLGDHGLTLAETLSVVA